MPKHPYATQLPVLSYVPKEVESPEPPFWCFLG